MQQQHKQLFSSIKKGRILLPFLALCEAD